MSYAVVIHVHAFILVLLLICSTSNTCWSVRLGIFKGLCVHFLFVGNLILKPLGKLASWKLLHVCLFVILHFDIKTNSVLEHQPEVTSFVLDLLSVSVSKEIFTLNFLVEKFFFLSDTKNVIILDDLCLSKSSLANIIFINSNHTVI